MANNKDTINHILDLAHQFKERKESAKSRLEEYPGKAWNFAILGIYTDVDEFSFDEIGVFRKVIDPPSEIELASALKQKGLFGAIGRYSHSITHELSISAGNESTQQSSFNLAWWIISALRVKTLAELLIPTAANYSWSVIAGLDDGACDIRLIEDIPQAKRLDEPVTLQKTDFDWVFENLLRFVNLLDKPKFRLAVDSLSTNHHQSNKRMMVSSLWAGIEAIIGVEHELRFRIAAYLSSYLYGRGSKRLDLSKAIKKLYDIRSKVVHGSSIDEKKLRSHILEVRNILSSLLIKVIENEKLPSQDDFDTMLLT